MGNRRKVATWIAAIIGTGTCVTFFWLGSIYSHAPTNERAASDRIPTSNQSPTASRPAYAPRQITADPLILKTAESSKVARSCLSDQISIVDIGGKMTTLCANNRWQGRDGPVQLFEFSDSAVPGDHLRVRAGNGRLLSIKYLKTSFGEYNCLNQECVGASISKPDRKGSVLIDLGGTTLRPSKSVRGTAKSVEMRLDGRLHGRSAQTCSESGITIDYSDGSSASFCSAGTGLETVNPDEEVYTFSSAEGETIAVTPGPDNSVKKVEVRSNSFQCSNGTCGGVSISSPNPMGEKTILFAGAMLHEFTAATAGVSNRTAILSGTLTTLTGEH
jgi:hypothetical protein